MPEASAAVLVRAPTAVNGTVHDGVQACPPRRTSNAAKRLRECLTPTEVEQLVQAAPVRGRDGARDPALPRAPEHRAHGALHGTESAAVQDVLE